MMHKNIFKLTPRRESRYLKQMIYGICITTMTLSAGTSPTTISDQVLEQPYQEIYVSEKDPQHVKRSRPSSMKSNQLILFNNQYLIGAYERDIRLYSLENPDKPYMKSNKVVGKKPSKGRKIVSSRDPYIIDRIKLIDQQVYVTSSELGYALKLYNVKDRTFESLGEVKDFEGKEIGLSTVPTNFAQSGELLFVASKQNGLLITDFSKRDSASLKKLNVLGRYVRIAFPGKDVHKTPVEVTDVFVLKDKAYVTLFNQGLAILDIRDPKNPKELSLYPFKGRGTKVLVQDGYAYILTPRQFLILNVQDSDKIQKVFAYSPKSAALRDVMIGENNKVYLSAGTEGLKIIDITDKEKPQILAEVPMEDKRKVCSAAVKDDRIYLAHCRRGLSVYRLKEKRTTP